MECIDKFAQKECLRRSKKRSDRVKFATLRWLSRNERELYATEKSQADDLKFALLRSSGQ